MPTGKASETLFEGRITADGDCVHLQTDHPWSECMRAGFRYMYRVGQKVNQSIKTHLYSSICREQISDTLFNYVNIMQYKL